MDQSRNAGLIQNQFYHPRIIHGLARPLFVLAHSPHVTRFLIIAVPPAVLLRRPAVFFHNPGIASFRRRGVEAHELDVKAALVTIVEQVQVSLLKSQAQALQTRATHPRSLPAGCAAYSEALSQACPLMKKE